MSRDEIMWEATIDDPDVYDRPWTVSMPMTRAPEYEMYDMPVTKGTRT